MNEIQKCSISGIAFTLDKEAYEVLKHYLETLQHAYRESPDGPEILADIEARIAELILSAQEGMQVVEKPLIEHIIQQLGSARDISESEEDFSDADLQPEATRIPRRFYRDMESAKLGGVCAGLGKYFKVDPVWIRLGIFLPILMRIVIPVLPSIVSNFFSNLFGVFVLSYIIMWFVVPVARSARQKLEMNGNPITTQSVASATVAANDVDTKAKSVVAETVSVLGKIVLVLLKIFAGMLVLGLILAACALFIGLMCVVIGGYEMLHFSPDEISIWLPISAILVALILVLLLIYVLMCLIASRKPNGKIILATFLLWIASIGTCIFFGIRAGSGGNIKELFQLNTSRSYLERPEMRELEEQLEALDEFSIEIRDSTTNVNVTVHANRKSAASEATAEEQQATE